MSAVQALQIYAGPRAFEHLQRHGLQPQDVGIIPGAAGGPKGLILGPLDRFIFGPWLGRTAHEVHLLGASIGAWRLAAACLPDAGAALRQFEQAYLQQNYAPPPGRKRPAPAVVSEQFSEQIQTFFSGQVEAILTHPRYRLHLFTARGRHLLAREQRARTAVGYAAAFLSNAVQRRALGAWLERVVFSSPGAALPFAAATYRTRQVALSAANFYPALQASCSIPFVLQSVPDIAGAPAGAYWDGGITDYHLHLDYRTPAQQLVLYPHFQRSLVPGWLDKHLPWRHRSTSHLDHVVLLAPRPQWVATLPGGKLPDRHDFDHYRDDFSGRVRVWKTAVAMSAQLAEEFAAWLERPDMRQVQRL